MREFTGIILAGGNSSRMGTDKGLVSLNGKPLIKHSIDLLESLGMPIIIVANTSKYAQFGYPVVKDLFVQKGPISGIYSGLLHSTTEGNVVLGCDTPYITTELIQQLLDASEGHEITLAKYQDQVHPLIGVYQRAITDRLKSNIEQNRLKLITMCTEIGNYEVSFDTSATIDAHNFTNINTVEDLKNEST